MTGWVDLVYTRRTLFEDEDSVTRTHDFESVTEAVDFIESQIGSVRDNGDLTFYAEDSDTDDVTGEDWSYAAHIEVQR